MVGIKGAGLEEGLIRNSSASLSTFKHEVLGKHFFTFKSYFLKIISVELFSFVYFFKINNFQFIFSIKFAYFNTARFIIFFTNILN